MADRIKVDPMRTQHLLRVLARELINSIQRETFDEPEPEMKLLPRTPRQRLRIVANNASELLDEIIEEADRG